MSPVTPVGNWEKPGNDSDGHLKIIGWHIGTISEGNSDDAEFVNLSLARSDDHAVMTVGTESRQLLIAGMGSEPSDAIAQNQE
jgi:hypothetical protein